MSVSQMFFKLTTWAPHAWVCRLINKLSFYVKYVDLPNVFWLKGHTPHAWACSLLTKSLFMWSVLTKCLSVKWSLTKRHGHPKLGLADWLPKSILYKVFWLNVCRLNGFWPEDVSTPCLGLQIDQQTLFIWSVLTQCLSAKWFLTKRTYTPTCLGLQIDRQTLFLCEVFWLNVCQLNGFWPKDMGTPSLGLQIGCQSLFYVKFVDLMSVS
jgi:hypothetical protein